MIRSACAVFTWIVIGVRHSGGELARKARTHCSTVMLRGATVPVLAFSRRSSSSLSRHSLARLRAGDAGSSLHDVTFLNPAGGEPAGQLAGWAIQGRWLSMN